MVPNTLSCQLNKKYENLKSQTLTVACGTDLIHDARYIVRRNLPMLYAVPSASLQEKDKF